MKHNLKNTKALLKTNYSKLTAKKLEILFKNSDSAITDMEVCKNAETLENYIPFATGKKGQFCVLVSKYKETVIGQ